MGGSRVKETTVKKSLVKAGQKEVKLGRGGKRKPKNKRLKK